jgi:lipoic acid synthetase
MKKIELHKKQTGYDKTSRIPIKIVPKPKIEKPSWIKMLLPVAEEYKKLKQLIQTNNLNSVCEEASCPNIGECFSHGIATFMILGDICTRRCPFCDVAHGRPESVDESEPKHLAEAISKLGLKYVVITSVDRDDLRDGGAQHFADCIKMIREKNPSIKIEILVPDFRGRMDKAIDILITQPPDVFNHNLETIPRLYKNVRPGSDYQHSLNLLKDFKDKFPEIPTKSGLMLGLGECYEEIIEVLEDLKKHQVDMVTMGQYLQPTIHHLPVERYLNPDEFESLRQDALKMGFQSVASAPMVRSSYHADKQALGESL